MLTTLKSLIDSPAFYLTVGLLLLALFAWYMAAENDRTKRNAGTFFIVGLSAFSLLSLFVNGMQYGIDIKGGVELTLEVQDKLNETTNKLEKPTEGDMQQACDILDERLNATGTSEVQILWSGNKILIQIPQQDKDPVRNEEKIDAMVKTLTKMAKLELLSVYRNSDEVISHPETQAECERYERDWREYTRRLAAGEIKLREPMLPSIPDSIGAGLEDYMILPNPLVDDKTGEPLLDGDGHQIIDFVVVERPYAAAKRNVYVTGKDVVSARPDGVQRGTVNVTLSREGARRMGDLTGAMEIGRDRLAVVLNNQVKCAPTVQAVLHKDFVITGLNAKGEPEDVSRALANPLSSDLKVEGRKDVSAQLGQSALDQGMYAGIVGMIGIFFFCYWYYRSAGIVAMVGLAINGLILLGLMSLFGFVLTLPGIAGIVLTLGVAVDANVLIYERMREERDKGRPFIVCLRTAYDKAFSAIFDSNLTSLITALILFWMASGSIKGFAVTTSVGIITSLIGAVVVTRVLFFWAEHTGILREFKFSKAPLAGKSFDFMRLGKLTFICSAVAILASVAYGVFVRGEDALGIDFMGGASITYVLPSDTQVDYDEIEDAVMGMTLSKTPTVQEFQNSGMDRNIKIRCANKQEAADIIAELEATVPHMKELPEGSASVEEVSASLGSTFFKTALWAMLAGLLGISLYLALRFEWSFAFGALVSTAHDLIGIIALVVLLGTELNIIHIGAFLTVMGYSINDTIVIYDRIRERLQTADPKEKLVDIMNEAINSTLSRTLLTSLSTVAALIALLALGGPSMRDFSLTMLLGIFIGTYSSIFIATPVVLWVSRKHDLRAEVQGERDAAAS